MRTAAPTVAKPWAGPSDRQDGVTLIVYGSAPDLETTGAPVFDRLVSIGANSVSIAFPFVQSSWTAAAVEAPAGLTPTTDDIATLIRLAKERRLAVMLRPVIDERTLIPDGQWRGSIRPSNVQAWFRSYQELLLRYARVGQTHGADLLCIGTELVSLEQERGRWLELIASVRAVFSGQLTYCANWDGFTRVPFWDALDAIGIDGFFELNAPVDAGVDALIAAWRPWTGRIADLSKIAGKPVLMTEVGVTSQRGSHQRPWLWDHRTAVDLETQRRYYRATCDAVAPVVTGIYWWAVDLALPASPTTDHGYNPLGKPAEAEIERCFE